MQADLYKLPSSGPITMGQIRGEFGRGNSLSGYYGAASGIPTSGRISFSDFYGKEAGGNLKPALTPTFGQPAPQKGGFVVQITNYDTNYTWSASPSAGTASIRSNGLMSVEGLADGQSSTVTVTTTRSGYATGSASVTGQAESGTIDPPPPTDTPIESVITGGSFTTSNGLRKLAPSLIPVLKVA